MNDLPKVKFRKKKSRELEFEIITIRSLFSRFKKLSPPPDRFHRIEFYTIMFVTNGNGVHFIDFQPLDYRKGSIIFISKGQVHAYGITAETEGYIILFTDSFLSKNLIHSDLLSLYRLYNHNLYSPILNPEEKERKTLKNIFDSIFEEYNHSDDFAKEDILRLSLKLLLLKAERMIKNLNTDKKNSEWVIKFGIFRDLLSKHCTETRDADDYAGMMNVSYKHLNEICKSVTGITAKKFIDSYVVTEIKRNIATSDLSVQELSYRFGFEEPTNFVKYFKKHEGKSPAQFRKAFSK